MALLNLRLLLYFSLIIISFAYELGVRNSYIYETKVLINEECDNIEKSDPVGHSVKAKVELTSIWQDPKNTENKLLKIEVSHLKLLVTKKSSGFEERKSDLEKIPASDSYFLLENDRIEKFWDNPKEHFVLRNLKRSVASLLQVKKKDGEEKLDDVAGKCDIFYKTEGSTMRRSKRRCRHSIEETVLSQPFGVRSPSVRSLTGIDCELKEDNPGVISHCLAIEEIETHNNLWQKASICVQSMSSFILESSSQSQEVFKNQGYNSVIEEVKKKSDLVESNLFAIISDKEEDTSIKVVDSVKSFQESIKTANLAKLKSASAFFKLLPAFRSASKEDILKVLENKKYESVLPQILDLVAASSTLNSLEAALTYFRKVKDYNENLERFLISLSVLPRPGSFILKEIKATLEKGNHDEKIEATLITTLGALLRTYAKSNKADTKVIDDTLQYLESSLKKCTSDSCFINHLRGLRNAAQPKSVPLLLQYALKGGKPALEAMLAIKNVPSLMLTEKNQYALQNVFNEVGMKQDRSTRAIAAEILLKVNPSERTLRIIIESGCDQTDAEFSTFVVSKVLNLMEDNLELRSRILKILSDKDVAHYYSLAQKGKSSLFKRLLMSTYGLNVTYGIEMELLEGGLLKRSSFDVDLHTDKDVSNLLSVGMFASGLSSFVGESSLEGEGDPTAGMELTVFGSSLRPYVFFSGLSELMGHAWSGTASELTPALQGIFSLSDDTQFVILHNGMVVKLELRGAMSTDLSASIQTSLWNKNSQSQVKNAAALLVKGAVTVDSHFALSRGEYLFYGNSAIDFSTDLDFADTPYKMCLQMEHPNIVVKMATAIFCSISFGLELSVHECQEAPILNKSVNPEKLARLPEECRSVRNKVFFEEDKEEEEVYSEPILRSAPE